MSTNEVTFKGYQEAQKAYKEAMLAWDKAEIVYNETWIACGKAWNAYNKVRIAHRRAGRWSGRYWIPNKPKPLKSMPQSNPNFEPTGYKYFRG